MKKMADSERERKQIGGGHTGKTFFSPGRPSSISYGNKLWAFSLPSPEISFRATNFFQWGIPETKRETESREDRELFGFTSFSQNSLDLLAASRHQGSKQASQPGLDSFHFISREFLVGLPRSLLDFVFFYLFSG